MGQNRLQIGRSEGTDFGSYTRALCFWLFFSSSKLYIYSTAVYRHTDTLTVFTIFTIYLQLFAFIHNFVCFSLSKSSSRIQREILNSVFFFPRLQFYFWLFSYPPSHSLTSSTTHTYHRTYILSIKHY